MLATEILIGAAALLLANLLIGLGLIPRDVTIVVAGFAELRLESGAGDDATAVEGDELAGGGFLNTIGALRPPELEEVGDLFGGLAQSDELTGDLSLGDEAGQKTLADGRGALPGPLGLFLEVG